MKFLRDNPPVSLDEIPSVEDIVWYPVEQRLKFQIFVRNLFHLLWFIPTLVFSVAVWLYMESIEPEAGFQTSTSLFQFSLATGIVVLTPLLPFRWFVVPLLEVPTRKYALRIEDLNYQRGLLTTIVSSAPFKRIQHASTQQYLLERMFNLASLEVFTAAGQAVRIAGLDPETARDLRDHLLNEVSKIGTIRESEGNLSALDSERDADLRGSGESESGSFSPRKG